MTENQQKRIKQLEAYARQERDKFDVSEKERREPFTNILAWIILINRDQ